MLGLAGDRARVASNAGCLVDHESVAQTNLLIASSRVMSVIPP